MAEGVGGGMVLNGTMELMVRNTRMVALRGVGTPYRLIAACFGYSQSRIAQIVAHHTRVVFWHERKRLPKEVSARVWAGFFMRKLWQVKHMRRVGQDG
jgi:hypothetical protein